MPPASGASPGAPLPPPPPLPLPGPMWNTASASLMALTGLASKTFLALGARTQVVGLERFVELLDSRRDVEKRERGLITVSNHVSVLDDPVIWGVLPLRYLCDPKNTRWSLGSYDICFQSKPLTRFFHLGQVLPTHRGAYSPHASPFQPTITQCVRLLSPGPFTAPTPPHPAWPAPPCPFSDDPCTTYTTTGEDVHPAPSARSSARHAWIHIFPEGKVHQHPSHAMRYFKWGIARLILEATPCPAVVPVWVDGLQHVMPENREWPRWLPRPGADVEIVFGDVVDEGVWSGFRARWEKLKERELSAARIPREEWSEAWTEGLRDGDEARELRAEVAARVREEVLKLRRSRGWPEEDPKSGAWETYKLEGARQEGRMEDGSWVKDT
ncbi:hypothetical protein EJ06DRAFT_529904 [Trichodelitschia bisporula]|uniref:Tafazzin family protein n=1 Tax=Trichodelitschia bisporula TaxID=703511 RepID=A0A6G1HY61_9PEZI|nr:hypothetical protein EJ06DRAFT_529904 [Trichodelitschia bisporula]